MRARGLAILGAILVVLGIVSLIHGGITYTRREQIVELGDVQIQTESKETIPLPPLFGGLSLAGGVLLVVLSRKGPGR